MLSKVYSLISMKVFDGYYSNKNALVYYFSSLKKWRTVMGLGYFIAIIRKESMKKKMLQSMYRGWQELWAEEDGYTKFAAFSLLPSSINDIEKDIFSCKVLLNNYFYRNFIKWGIDYSKIFSQISAIAFTFFLSSYIFPHFISFIIMASALFLHVIALRCVACYWRMKLMLITYNGWKKFLNKWNG